MIEGIQPALPGRPTVAREKPLAALDRAPLNAGAESLVKIPCANYKVSMYKSGIPGYLFRVCCAACIIAIAPIGTGFRASAQTPSTDLSFEVATVKPTQLDPAHPFNTRSGIHVNLAGASYGGMAPEWLVAYAYGVETFQVTGPDWAKHDRFDIEARFPEGTDKKDEHRMLQSLLRDRFKLAFHIEKRELESHVLVVGKHGEKLKPSVPDPASPETDAALKPGDSNAVEAPAQTKITKKPDGSSVLDYGEKGIETLTFDDENRTAHHEHSKMTMQELAVRLSICLGRGVHKVVDETGIKGTYQIAWDCPMSGLPPARGTNAAGMLPSDPEGGSSLNQSLDALGLKLETRKTLQDVYVIDHVERPSEN